MKKLNIFILTFFIIFLVGSFLSPKFISPSEEKILPVPAYNQMLTPWCHFISACSILNYYGIKKNHDFHNYKISTFLKPNELLYMLNSDNYNKKEKLSKLSKYFNQFLSYFRLIKLLKNIFKLNVKFEFINSLKFSNEFLNEFFNIVRYNINLNRPVILTYFYNLFESHSVTVIGYNNEGIIINDSSGYLYNLIERYKKNKFNNGTRSEDKEKDIEKDYYSENSFYKVFNFGYHSEYFHTKEFIEMLKSDPQQYGFYAVFYPFYKQFLEEEFFNCKRNFILKWDDIVFLKKISYFLIPFIFTEIYPKEQYNIDYNLYNVQICNFNIICNYKSYTSYIVENNQYGYRLTEDKNEYKPKERVLVEINGSIFLLEKPKFLYELKLSLKLYDSKIDLIKEKNEIINLRSLDTYKINFILDYYDLNNLPDDDWLIIIEVRDINDCLLTHDFLIIPKDIEKLIDK